MLPQEFHRTRPRRLGCLFVIARALIAMKSMAGIGIRVDFGLRSFFPDGLDVAHRNALVLLAEMHLDRHFRLLVSEFRDLAPVIGNRHRETIKTRRGEESDGPAHAEAD